MGIRSTVGSVLESVVGRERTNRIRLAERKARGDGRAQKASHEETGAEEADGKALGDARST